MNPVGRPSEYKEEYITKVDEYLELCQDEEVQQLVGMSAKGTELYKNKLDVKIPTIEGFALFLEVSKQSLYTWAKENKLFLDALAKIEAEQKNRLISKGLSGDYNSTIAKLLLSANHGMREKTEQDITSGGKPIAITFDPIFNETPRETTGDSEIPGSV